MRNALRFLPALLWMGVIYRSSATPGLKSVPVVQRLGLLPSELSPGVAHWAELLLRKSAHFGSYAILALLLVWACAAVMDRRRAWLTALAVVVLYAVSDEWHQTFVANREGRWFDVVIDTGGALAVLGLCRWPSEPLRQGG